MWDNGAYFLYVDGQCLCEGEPALRRQYVESTVSINTFHLPVVDGAGNRYRLYLRDSVPLEDARGLIRPR